MIAITTIANGIQVYIVELAFDQNGTNETRSDKMKCKKSGAPSIHILPVDAGHPRPVAITPGTRKAAEPGPSKVKRKIGPVK